MECAVVGIAANGFNSIISNVYRLPFENGCKTDICSGSERICCLIFNNFSAIAPTNKVIKIIVYRCGSEGNRCVFQIYAIARNRTSEVGGGVVGCGQYLVSLGGVGVERGSVGIHCGINFVVQHNNLARIVVVAIAPAHKLAVGVRCGGEDCRVAIRIYKIVMVGGYRAIFHAFNFGGIRCNCLVFVIPYKLAVFIKSKVIPPTTCFFIGSIAKH